MRFLLTRRHGRRLFSDSKGFLKEALETGPKFADFVSEKVVSGDGRLPKWLKTPIAVGERYTHLKETLRDLKLHTVIFESESWILGFIILRFLGL